MGEYPYPNVRRVGRGWAAYLPGRPLSRYLGMFDTPEAAYAAILRLQAERHDRVAEELRAKAESLAS